MDDMICSITIAVVIAMIGACIICLLGCLIRYLIEVFPDWAEDRREKRKDKKKKKNQEIEGLAIDILREMKKVLDENNSENIEPIPQNDDDLDTYPGRVSDKIEDAYTELQKDIAWDDFCQGLYIPITVYRKGRVPIRKVHNIFAYMNDNNLTLANVCSILAAYSLSSGVREVIKDLYFLSDYETDAEINNAPNLYIGTIEGEQSCRVFKIWKQTEMLWKDVVNIIEIGWGTLAAQNLDKIVNEYFRKGA